MICSDDRDKSLSDNYDPDQLDIVSMVLNSNLDAQILIFFAIFCVAWNTHVPFI